MKKNILISVVAIIVVSITTTCVSAKEVRTNDGLKTYNEITDVNEIINIACNQLSTPLVATPYTTSQVENDTNIEVNISDNKLLVKQKLSEKNLKSSVVEQEFVLSAISIYNTDNGTTRVTSNTLNEYNSKSMNGYSVACNIYFTCTITPDLIQMTCTPKYVTTTVAKTGSPTLTISSGSNTMRVVQEATTKYEKSSYFSYSNSSMAQSQTFSFYPTGLSTYYINGDRAKWMNDIYGTSRIDFSDGTTLWVYASIWDYLNRY